MPSVADTARSNMLTELGLTSSKLSNVDLMALVQVDPGQTTWTFVSGSVANNYWRYLSFLG